jgi:hypothetical protein
MLQGAMVGVSRRMLESGAAEKQFDGLRRELILMACAYVDACSTRVSGRGEENTGPAVLLQIVGENVTRTVTKSTP